ncbi:MAG: D-alanyl-D-alanine carboxypeptidase [Oscillospiraceae bacterium]|nr:D-alanyl-D-alanine carboxypeptidase [Oscillospiraceae bacterium]
MKRTKRLIATLLILVLCILTLPVTALCVPAMNVEAEAALLADYDNNEILYEKNAYEKMYPASTTKIMTALLTLEAVDSGKLKLDQVVSGSSNIISDLRDDGSTQNIKLGEQMTVENLLYCALLASANEACNILAEAVSGSLDGFHALMNQRARQLGCTGTHFANAHGLPNDAHYTTAHDLYLIARAAMGHAEFVKICDTAEYTVPATNLSPARRLYTTNYLLSSQIIPGYTYKYATGIKTGSTDEAGHCLVASAVKNGRTLVSVVMGAENVQKNGKLERKSFSESQRLLEWGFNNFTRCVVLDANSPACEMPVTLSREADYVVLHPEGELKATLPYDLDTSKFEKKITLNAKSVEAPVKKGQVLGYVAVTCEGKEYGRMNLVALSDVSRSNIMYSLDRLSKFFKSPITKLALLVLVIFILFLIARRVFGFGPRRQNKSHWKHKAYRGRKRR